MEMARDANRGAHDTDAAAVQRRIQELESAPADGREKGILHALEDESPVVRDRAIALAARFVAPEVLGVFVGNDENSILRNSALQALERQGPYAVPHLMKLSRDPNLEVAMFAVQILSRIRDPSTVQALLPLLDHPDSNIAQAAVEALGNVKAREAVPGLIRLLDADLWVQFAAVAALGEIADPRAVGPLLDAIPNEMLAEPAVEALAKIASPDALPRLLGLLADQDRLPLRDQVLRAIFVTLERHAPSASVFTRFRRKLDEDGTEPSLVHYLQGLLRSDEKDLSRGAASLALAAQLSQLYPDSVLRALSKEPDEARWFQALCRRHEKVLRASFGELLGHSDAQVRRGALLSLSFDEGAMPALIARLSDPEPLVRAAACQALGRRRDATAISALVERFAQGDAVERAAAAEALGSMPGQSLLLLSPFLEPDCSQEMLLEALHILETAKSPLFEDKVIDLLSASRAVVRRAALRLLINYDSVDFEEHLVRALDDSDESVRIESVELIVRHGSSKAIPALIGLLGVSDELRYHVIRGLGRLRATAAAHSLETLFPNAKGHEKIEVVAALIRIGAPGTLPFLKARLGDPDPELRRVAADGIARLASPSELSLLIQLAADTDWNVRNHAGWGLGRLGLAEGRSALLALVRDVEAVVARTARTALQKLPPE